MFSTVIQRVTPSLRQQLRPRTAAATHTQAASAAAAPSKLDEGEQAIYDKLSERFQPSELLVQDVSGASPE
jgi:BolA-like protein 3